MNATEQLWYNDISNEIVDGDNSELEKQISDYIDSKVKPEEDNLWSDALESLEESQLADFLSAEYFSWWSPKTYTEIMSIANETYLWFSLRAALQMLAKNDTTKYDESWNKLENWNWKTALELLWSESWGGLTNSVNEGVVRILQNLTGAYVDGKAGPQTITLLISALGWDISSVAEWVNSLYSNSEQFQIDREWWNEKLDEKLNEKLGETINGTIHFLNENKKDIDTYLKNKIKNTFTNLSSKYKYFIDIADLKFEKNKNNIDLSFYLLKKSVEKISFPVNDFLDSDWYFSLDIVKTSISKKLDMLDKKIAYNDIVEDIKIQKYNFTDLFKNDNNKNNNNDPLLVSSFNNIKLSLSYLNEKNELVIPCGWLNTITIPISDVSDDKNKLDKDKFKKKLASKIKDKVEST